MEVYNKMLSIFFRPFDKTPYTIDPSVIRNVKNHSTVGGRLVISDSKFAKLSDSEIRGSLIRYSFNIINDSLIIKGRDNNLKEYVKLTDILGLSPIPIAF